MNKPIKSLLLATSLMGLVPLKSMAGVFISVSFGPPVLPVYEQPLCPGPGYLWTPGYWAFADGAYYWVPGTWVMAPEPGLLWTPGYWAYESSAYFWHPGYWGPRVGFYGGVDYGYGYSGVGYQGGYWNHNEFNYNRTVNNISVTNVNKTYNTPVIDNNPNRHVAYNGGPGGVHARPNAQEQLVMREPHFQKTHGQLENEQAARRDPFQRVSANHGHPGVLATPTPAVFHGPGSVMQSRKESAPVMPQHPVPRVPVVSYDPKGRSQMDRPSESERPQPRAPQYRYSQVPPQSSRPTQHVQIQPPAMNDADRQEPVLHPQPPHYEDRGNAPQAYHPQTMAQFHPQPGNSRMNAPSPGAYRPAMQPPHDRATPARPHGADTQAPQAQPSGTGSARSRHGQI